MEAAKDSASHHVEQCEMEASKPAPQRAMYGWDDEDDEFMSDSEEEEEVSEEDKPQYDGKGKGKAV